MQPIGHGIVGQIFEIAARDNGVILILLDGPQGPVECVDFILIGGNLGFQVNDLGLEYLLLGQAHPVLKKRVMLLSRSLGP